MGEGVVVSRAPGGDFCTYLSRSLCIKVNFHVVRHREGLNLAFSLGVVSSSAMLGKFNLLNLPWFSSGDCTRSLAVDFV